LENVDCCIRPPRTNYNCDFFPNFKGKLRPLQKKVKKEVIGYLNKSGCCWLSLYTGGGKTFTSINIACSIKLKTIIITHRVNLMNQWISSIERGCGEGVIAQILTGVNKINEHAQFYIMNAINVKKRNISDYKDIGFLIVDEVHVMATKIMVEAFQYLTPRYCLALSATPYRSDGLDEVLYTYFSKNKIIIKLNKPHTVFKITTKFEPDVKLNYDGSTDWSSVIESMCNNKERNNLIVNIVQLFKNRNFLILSKRIDQIDYLTQQLREKGESVTSFKGSKQKYNCESRILIATISKAGVGFDHPKMDALILASDVEEYFIQYLGRVFRREDVHPLIFDIVDNFNSLKRHYYTRKKVYEESGGTILKFNKENITNFTNNSDDYNKFF
jgi:superfamily II DNA or RNA helicase